MRLNPWILLFSIAIFIGSNCAFPAAPELVKDISTKSGSASPSNFCMANGIVFFTANTPDAGIELWKTDGTAAGTVMVKDIYPGSTSSGPNNFIAYNNALYFSAMDPVNGVELWKSDGTAAGTVLVADIWPGSGWSMPSGFAVVNNILVFSADSPNIGREVWRSDGTTAGTFLLKDLSTGSSDPQSFVRASAVYFVSNSALWITDGSMNGTFPMGAGGNTPTQLTPMSTGRLFFASNDASGNELWTTNGSTAGTVLVKDIFPGGNSGIPYNLTDVNGICYFVATDGVNGFELWKSDGTAAGTVLVKDINPGANSSNPSFLCNVNGTLYFAADNGANGMELWKSNGTAVGTVLVKDINPGIAASNPRNLVNLNGTLFFSANNGSAGEELWRSDGTAAGTTLVKDVNPGATTSAPTKLFAAGTKLYFSADDGISGAELWVSDGTTTGTVRVKDIVTSTLSSNPTSLTVAGNTLFFNANDGVNGAELWRSDGTSTGTFQVRDINAAPNIGSQPGPLVALGGSVLFSADDGSAAHGRELWKSDGSSAGTVLLKDINPGVGLASNPANFTNVNGTIFFVADDGQSGNEIWKSDGTTAGTLRVSDIVAGAGSSFPANLTALNGTLFFSATVSSSGTELWKSDGTAPGTVLVKDIVAGAGSANPNSLTAFNGAVYFSANDPLNGGSLYKSDGTAAGTVLVKGFVSAISNCVPFNGKLFFAGSDNVHGIELWCTDGTTAGTIMVADIQASGSSFPNMLMPVNNLLYFVATTGATGAELWKSDGTTAGTVMVKEIVSGVNGASITQLINAEGVLFFCANDGVNGAELWKSNGTASGTVMVSDLYPGIPGSNPRSFAAMNGYLYFVADHPSYGAELWRLLIDDPPVVASATCSPNPVNGTTATLSVTATDDAGETALIYTWDVVGTPPGPVAFGAQNGVNSSKSMPVTFVTAGNYIFQVTVQDEFGKLASATVNVSVVQVARSITVTPTSVVFAPSAVQQFVAIVKDQFSNPMQSQPVVAWTVSGGGTVSIGGLLTASASAGGPFTLTASASGFSTHATFTIKSAAVSIAASVGSAAEHEQNQAYFTVTRTGATASELRVNYTIGGTATNGTDYSALPGYVIIPAGATTATIAVNPVDDAVAEKDETVILTLSTGTGYATTTPTSATITIIDDDAPVITISATDATAAEPGTDTGQFTLTRLGDKTQPLTVNLSISGTATPSSDYVALPGTITLGAGIVTGTLQVTALDDSIAEPDETVVVTVLGGSGYLPGSPASATVTILDDEAPVLTVSVADSTASEPGTDTGKFQINRLGSKAAALTVNFTTTGTATNGTDYSAIGTTVSLGANAANTTVTVTPLNDALVEGPETVVFTLASGTGYAVGSPNTATITIVDDEPSVTIAATDAVAFEPGTDTGTFTVTRTGILTNALTVFYAVSGTATPGTDYTALSGSVVIAANANTATILVKPLNDVAVEVPETVIATLSPNAVYAIGPGNTATITIGDNDAPVPTVSVSATDAVASEPGTDTGKFTFTRTGLTTSPLIVFYSISGTATAGLDYTALSGSLTIPVGAATQVLNVLPIDDTLAELSETVVVTLKTDATYAVGSPNNATVTISDNEAPQIAISATDGTAAEPGTDTGKFTLTRYGSTAAALTVNYVISGTAVNGIDYVLLPGTASIPAGQSTTTIVVTILDDLIPEPDETVIITLAPGSGYSVIPPSSATVTILDDETPTLNIAATDAKAAEPGTDTGTFTITRLGKKSVALPAITYSIYGTATSGSDYVALSGTTSLAANAASTTIVVTPLDDTIAEDDETVTLVLTDGTGYVAGAQNIATVTIVDNEAPVVSLIVSDPSASEAGHDTGSFTFLRTGNKSSALTVNFTRSGTATPGLDYAIASTTSILIPANTSAVTLDILPNDDLTIEGDETVILTLGTGTGYTVGPTSTGTVTIHDDPLVGGGASGGGGNFVLQVNDVRVDDSSLTGDKQGTLNGDRVYYTNKTSILISADVSISGGTLDSLTFTARSGASQYSQQAAGGISSASLDLPDEGRFELSATAVAQGKTAVSNSTPKIIIIVDRTPPHVVYTTPSVYSVSNDDSKTVFLNGNNAGVNQQLRTRGYNCYESTLAVLGDIDDISGVSSASGVTNQAFLHDQNDLQRAACSVTVQDPTLATDPQRIQVQALPDNASIPESIVFDSQTNYDTAFNILQINGAYTFHIKLTDRCGNTNDSRASDGVGAFRIWKDKTPPAVAAGQNYVHKITKVPTLSSTGDHSQLVVDNDLYSVVSTFDAAELWQDSESDANWMYKAYFTPTWLPVASDMRIAQNETSSFLLKRITSLTPPADPTNNPEGPLKTFSVVVLDRAGNKATRTVSVRKLGQARQTSADDLSRPKDANDRRYLSPAVFTIPPSFTPPAAIDFKVRDLDRIAPLSIPVIGVAPTAFVDSAYVQGSSWSYYNYTDLLWPDNPTAGGGTVPVSRSFIAGTNGILQRTPDSSYDISQMLPGTLRFTTDEYETTYRWGNAISLNPDVARTGSIVKLRVAAGFLQHNAANAFVGAGFALVPSSNYVHFVLPGTKAQPTDPEPPGTDITGDPNQTDPVTRANSITVMKKSDGTLDQSLILDPANPSLAQYLEINVEIGANIAPTTYHVDVNMGAIRSYPYAEEPNTHKGLNGSHRMYKALSVAKIEFTTLDSGGSEVTAHVVQSSLSIPTIDLNGWGPANVSVNSNTGSTTVLLSGIIRDNLCELAANDQGGNLDSLYVIANGRGVGTLPLTRVDETTSLWRPYACRFEFNGSVTFPATSGINSITLTSSMNGMGQSGYKNLTFTTDVQYPQGQPQQVTATVSFAIPTPGAVVPSASALDSLVLQLPTSTGTIAVTLVEDAVNSNHYVGSQNGTAYELTIDASSAFNALSTDYISVTIKQAGTAILQTEFFETDVNTGVYTNTYFSNVPQTFSLLGVNQDTSSPGQSWHPVAIRTQGDAGQISISSVAGKAATLTDLNNYKYVSGSPIHIYVFPATTIPELEKMGLYSVGIPAPSGIIKKVVIEQVPVPVTLTYKLHKLTKLDDKNSIDMPASFDQIGNGLLKGKVGIKNENVEKSLEDLMKDGFQKVASQNPNPYETPENLKIRQSKLVQDGTVKIVMNHTGPKMDINVLLQKSSAKDIQLCPPKKIDATDLHTSLYRIEGCKLNGVNLAVSLEIEPEQSVNLNGTYSFPMKTYDLQDRMRTDAIDTTVAMGNKLLSATVEGDIDFSPLIAASGAVNIPATFTLRMNPTTKGGTKTAAKDLSIAAGDKITLAGHQLNNLVVKPAMDIDSKQKKYVSTISATIAKVQAPNEYEYSYTVGVLGAGTRKFDQKFLAVQPIHVIFSVAYGDVLPDWVVVGTGVPASALANDKGTAKGVDIMKNYFEEKGEKVLVLVNRATGNNAASSLVAKADAVVPIIWDESGNSVLKQAIQNAAMKKFGTKYVGITAFDIDGHGPESGIGLAVDTPPDAIAKNVKWVLTCDTVDDKTSAIGIDTVLKDLGPNLMPSAQFYYQVCFSAKDAANSNKNLALKTAICSPVAPISASGFDDECIEQAVLDPKDLLGSRYKPKAGTKWWTYTETTVGGEPARIERVNRLKP